MVSEEQIKLSVLTESIRQHSNRRITKKVVSICEKYIDNVVIDWENEEDYWLTGITYTDENGDDRKVAIVSEDEFNKMVNEIFK